MKLKIIIGAAGATLMLWATGAQGQAQGYRICGPIGNSPGLPNCTDGSSTAVAAYPSVSVGYQAGALNGLTNTTAVGPAAFVSANNGVALGANSSARAVGSTALGTNTLSSGVNSVAIGQGSDDSGRANVFSVGSVPSVLQPGGITRQIINVAAGTVAAASTDAVNGAQLFAVQQLASQAAVSANAVQYDTAARTSVTLNAGGAATPLRNVAAGTAATDAANVAQLTAALNSAVATSQSYTDQRVNTLSSQINGFAGQIGDLSTRIAKVSRDASAGTASAIASSNIPQAFSSGRTMIGGAVGSWNGEAAFALGASHMFEGGRFAVRGSANFDSRGSTGGGVGFGVSF